MQRDIVIAIVGAGSSYTPELVEGLLATPGVEIPLRELRLCDVDERRLGTMAGLTRRMCDHAGRRIAVLAGRELERLVAGADFVVCQIRVGGMDARQLDETIPLKYGIIGQETTGPGGMFKALRTIPWMLHIARTVERVAPQAFLLNYTNPSGIVAEAVLNHSRVRFVGLCSGIPGLQEHIAKALGDRWPDLRTYCVGLNHLGFIHRFVSGAQDVSAAAVAALADSTRAAGDADGAALIEALQAYPISYLRYYYRRAAVVTAARHRAKTRAEAIREIEAEVFADAAQPERATKPAALARRGGGGYAAITSQFLRAILHDRGDERVCTVLNGSAVDGLPGDAGVEVVCRVDAHGAVPLPVGPIPLAFRGLVQAVKTYETLTVRAAIERSRVVALQALLAHPLCGDLDIASPLLDEMLAAHGLDFG